MIEEESFKLSVYEYFKYCLEKPIRGVGLITDKQSIFYSQVGIDDYKAHEWVACELEDIIHPNDKRQGWASLHDENVHFFSVGEELIIDLPKNDKLTISQYNFLVDVLKQIKIFNEQYPKYKIWLLVSTDSKYLKDHSRFDIDEVIEKLKYIVERNNKNIVEEKIIGKTRNKEDIINDMIFSINLSNARNLKDLNQSFVAMDKYYKDGYYNKYLMEIFKDYIRVKEKLKMINNLNVEGVNINIPLTFENIEDYFDNLISKRHQEIKSKEMEGLKKTIINYVNLESVNSLSDLRLAFHRMNNYYSNELYRDIFLNIFKDYLEVKNIYNFIESLNIEFEINNLNFSNIKNNLNLLLNNIFDNRNFEEIYHILNQIKIFSNIDYYPNLNLLLSVCEKIYLVSDIKKLESLLINASGYEMISEIIFEYYIELLDKQINEYTEFLNNNRYFIDRYKRMENIKKNKDVIIKLINDKMELSKFKNQVSSALRLLNIKVQYLEKDQMGEKNSLNSKIKILTDKANRLQNKISNIEESFCKLTGLKVYDMNLEYLNNYLLVMDNYDMNDIENQEINISKALDDLQNEKKEIEKVLEKNKKSRL